MHTAPGVNVADSNAASVLCQLSVLPGMSFGARAGHAERVAELTGRGLARQSVTGER